MEVYVKRLQVQEKMTVQIADTLQEVLQPKGVAVVIEAAYQCMTTRGVHKPGVGLVTSRMLGAFRDDRATRREFLAIIGLPAQERWPTRDVVATATRRFSRNGTCLKLFPLTARPSRSTVRGVGAEIGHEPPPAQVQR